jgi:hypothetical protein
MKKNGFYFILFLSSLCLRNPVALMAQSFSKTFWTSQRTPVRSVERTWYPKSYQSFSLDLEGMKGFLSSSPMQKSVANHSSEYIIELPMPDGSFHRYAIVESPIMDPELAAQFPEIKTYAGQGIDDRTATIRCDVTMFGFHGYVLSQSGTIYIDPVSLNDTRNYLVYYKKEIPAGLFRLECSAQDEKESVRRNDESNSLAALDGNLRTYRLALAADYEYCQYYGGTTGGALAGIAITLNRVDGVYRKELDIHLSLIGAEASIIYAASAGYTSTNDPYTNNDQPPGVILGENQSNMNAVIGSGNYDIGHVFTTGAGGLANVSCVCQTDKASGATGLSNPATDAFDIDYVCHEMGHQFGGTHTFNAETGACAYPNRAAYSAYEPGSGSTIMAYTGICGLNDLQPHSDAYFHTRSFDEITLYTQNGTGNTCASLSAGGNLPPVVIIPTSYNIPVNTSFRLSATGSDPDGGVITYCWEEYDKSGTQYGQSWNEQSAGVNAPIFRSFFPIASAERIFPKWSSIIDDTTIVGEVLPAYARQLHFRCTVRDNNSACGGVTNSIGSTAVNVISHGPGFAVTQPSKAGVEWDKRKEHNVVWEVAGTNSAADINTQYVNIYLSTDGGNTFPDTIGMHVDNLGSYSFMLPSWIVNMPNSSHIDNARILIEAEGNIFFDVSNNDFRIDTVDVLEPLDSSFVIKFINLNVVANEITFKLEAPMEGSFLISIYNSLGELARQYPLKKTTQLVERTLDISDLTGGFYVIRFDGPDYSLKRKFVKVHPE